MHGGAGMKIYIADTGRSRISYACLPIQRSSTGSGPLEPSFGRGTPLGYGISWRDLYRARDSGLLIEVSRGLFQLRETVGIDQIDFVVVCARAPQGMVCLGSALAYWDLSDETPTWVDLAVPAGTHRPQIDYPPTRVHVFGATNFGLGRIEVLVSRTSTFASPTPNELSSIASDSDTALGSTSLSPVFAGTFAARTPNQAVFSNSPRSCEFGRRSSMLCGCCRNEPGSTRLDCWARLPRPPADGTSARSTDPRAVADLRARAVPLSAVEVCLSRQVDS